MYVWYEGMGITKGGKGKIENVLNGMNKGKDV